jgi:hypothetical protein
MPACVSGLVNGNEIYFDMTDRLAALIRDSSMDATKTVKTVYGTFVIVRMDSEIYPNDVSQIRRAQRPPRQSQAANISGDPLSLAQFCIERVASPQSNIH